MERCIKKETGQFCRDCRKDVHCCIFNNDSGFVAIDIKNAKQIRSRTKLEYRDFLEYSPLPKKIINALKNDDPSLEGALRYSQLDDKGRILRLKTRIDKKKNKVCIFLNDERKCKIYDIRPDVCRIYPFWAIRLDSGKIKIIKHESDSRCKIVSGIKTNHELEKNLSTSQVSDIKKTFKRINKEKEHYKKNIKKFVKDNNIV